MIASPRTCLMAGKGIHRRRTPERHRRRRRRRRRHHPTDSAPKPDGCESERGTWRKNQPGRNARDKQQIPKGFRKRRPAGIVFRCAPFHSQTVFDLKKHTSRPGQRYTAVKHGFDFCDTRCIACFGAYSRENLGLLFARFASLYCSPATTSEPGEAIVGPQSSRNGVG